MIMGIGGMAMATVFGYYTGKEFGAVAGMLSGIVCLMPLIEMILISKTKGFLPLFWNLEEENGIKKEKYLMVPNVFGRLRLMVAKMVADGVIFVKRWGFIDDKGTEYSFGNSPLSFVIPRLGFTKNIPSSQYHHLLKSKDPDIHDWDTTVKKYLGDDVYKKDFLPKFRVNPEPDSADIQAELQWLKDVKNPADPLAIPVAGETMTFHDDIEFFQYNYLPEYMKVFVENEKMNVKLREQGYKDPGKAMSYAKAIAVVLLVVMVVIIALASVNLKGLTGLFGGH